MAPSVLLKKLFVLRKHIINYSANQLFVLIETVHLLQAYTYFGDWLVGWLVGFGFNGRLRQYFSLYRAVSQREGERGKDR